MTLGKMTVSACRSFGLPYVLIAAMTNLAVVPLGAIEPRSLQASTQVANQGRVESTQVVINGGIVNVTYDLIAPQSTFDVRLEASQNGGDTYDVIPKAVTGDVGAGIRPGMGKRIVWEAAKDTDSLQLGQLRFRVTIKPEASGVTAESTPAAGSNQPPPRQPAAPTPARGAQQTPAGSRNPFFWPGIGAIGGGIVLAAAGAAGPLRSTESGYDFCYPYGCFDPSLVANKPVIGLGVGVAAGGAVLLFIGKRRASRVASIAAVPQGFLIYHVVPFD